jgi:hypothetical protein
MTTPSDQPLARGEAPQERHRFTPDSTGQFCAVCGSSVWGIHRFEPEEGIPTAQPHTETPPTQALRALVEQWRKSFSDLRDVVVTGVNQYFAQAMVFQRCADELEAALASPEPETPQGWQPETVYRIEVFREDDGRFAAEFETNGGREAGMSNYAATPIGAMAELCSTLIMVEEDKRKHPAPPLSPERAQEKE